MLYFRYSFCFFNSFRIAKSPKLNTFQELTIELSLHFITFLCLLEHIFRSTQLATSPEGRSHLLSHFVKKIRTVDHMSWLNITPLDELVEYSQHMDFSLQAWLLKLFNTECNNSWCHKTITFFQQFLRVQSALISSVMLNQLLINTCKITWKIIDRVVTQTVKVSLVSLSNFLGDSLFIVSKCCRSLPSHFF